MLLKNQTGKFSLLCLTLLLLIVFCSSCQKNTSNELQPLPPSVQKNESIANFLMNLSPKEMHPNGSNGQAIQSWKALEPSIKKSLIYVNSKKPETLAISRAGLVLTYGDLKRTLELLRDNLSSLDQDPSLFTKLFTWISIPSGIDYTGYFEPTLKASRTYKAGYYPIYKYPNDVKQVKRKRGKYYSRKEIDGDNVLAGKGLELAYADLVDIFFLQVQGSGRLLFEDGSSEFVCYAGQNGHKYVSSRRIMEEKGLVEKGTVSAQKKWFAENPERIFEILQENPSYVFFRFGDGATGAMGQVVSPWQSLAVDRDFLPLGSIIAYGVNIPAEKPDASNNFSQRKRGLRGIGFAQDVGGAINRNRIDIFCGAGDYAKYVAGHLDKHGIAWVLVAK